MLKSIALSAALLMTVPQKLDLLSARLSKDHSRKLRQAIKVCPVSSNLLLAIIKVESDFKVNAYNKKSNDYGLMQINEWHVKRKGLSKQKLLTDPSYNIAAGCIIIKWFLKNYSLEEAVARYNGGTAKNVPSYPAVKRYVKKVLKYKKILDEAGK